MELKIQDYSAPSAIDFNFDELKSEVATKMADYVGLVYTEEQVPEAKKDIATMRKFVSALDDARKAVKKDILKPYEAFEKKINEIKAIVEEPIGLIDKQLKDYEEQRKADKSEAIQECYMGFETKPEFADFLFEIFNPKWLNASYSMAAIKAEIEDRIEKYWAGRETVSKLKEYQFEAMEEYNKTLDVGKALEKQMYLKDLAERKAAYEAEMAETKAKYDAIKVVKADDEKTENKGITEPYSDKTWVKFEVLVSVEQAGMLKGWLDANNIEIRRA